MNRSETIAALAKALAIAQGAIKAAKKGVENDFYHSSYADLPAVMEVCRKPLSDNGIAVVQATDFDDAGNMWIETTLIHSSGEWISGRWPLSPTKRDPQGIMSANTYARRGALMSLVGIVADDGSDDDGNAASGIDRGDRRIESKPKPKVEAGDDKIATAASKWGNGILVELAKVKTLEDFNRVWNRDAAQKGKNLMNYHKELGEIVQKRVDTLLDRFNPVPKPTDIPYTE